MQSGAWPCMALKVIIKILKSILNLTGSQCKENNTGVTWLKRGVEQISLAAAFCTRVQWDGILATSPFVPHVWRLLESITLSTPGFFLSSRAGRGGGGEDASTSS